jgi:SnoaL-like domain
MNNADYSPQRLAARAEIQDVMLRWCRAVDRCDWNAIRAVFHPDGHDNHGIYQGNVDGLIAWLSERHKTITRSMHIVGNMLIEFADDDTALVESYTLALQRYAAGGAQTRAAISGGTRAADGEFDMLMSGRYVDEFRRRNGAWKVQNRTVVFDNSTIFPVPLGAPKLGDDWAVSTRDANDPLWAIRRRLGLTR